YTIKSLLGEGGMGEVYLARDEDLGRQVAIKLIKRAFSRASFVRQFRREERILAGLTHPNIAQLHGVGVTEDDLPYFVMEYVEGDRLDHFCATRKPALRERLALFQKICAAVSYAHQHLVIHRDLKPGNIRVTPDGEPKLLDFGIAKLIDDSSQMTGETISIAGLMTPEYASPEQVRGESMTTASDVYSLGVILYEMLSGEKPYRLTSRRPEEISRAITESQPARPSAVTSSDGQPKAESRKALRGDLDNIVLMAMRKERERRYTSVGQFSADIARHLAGRPVIARKDTWTYRSEKFIRRHKVSVAAAILLLASLLGGIFATTYQARRAEHQRELAQRRFDEVRRLARSLMFEIHDSVADLPGSTPTRQLIVSRALEYLNNLSEQAADDPSLARELSSAYVKVGNVQGNPNNSNLGDRSGALESYRKAKQLAEHLLSAKETDALARRSLGIADEKIADVEAAIGNVPAAVASARRSLAAFKKLADAAPTDVAAQQSLAISVFKLGDVLGNPNYPNTGDVAGALAQYQEALRIFQSLPPPGPDDFKRTRLVGVVEERLGTMFEVQGNVAEAQQHYASSKAIRLQLAEQHADNSDIVRDAAVAHEKIANIQVASHELEAALESRQRSLEIFNDLAKADPKNVYAQRSLAISYVHLAELLGGPAEPNLAQREEAIGHYEHAAEILAKQADADDAKTRATTEEIREKLQKLRAP
ncbi:MAG: protein kinase, partial [Verrucomicrobiota bacterium]|nr:protein kinase [Verrucomicrobiota bacterium]